MLLRLEETVERRFGRSLLRPIVLLLLLLQVEVEVVGASQPSSHPEEARAMLLPSKPPQERLRHVGKSRETLTIVMMKVTTTKTTKTG